MHETFWTLLRDKAHWEFEIFLMILFDLIIGGLAWPFLKKHWAHHVRLFIELGYDAYGEPSKTWAQGVVVLSGGMPHVMWHDGGATSLIDTGSQKWAEFVRDMEVE